MTLPYFDKLKAQLSGEEADRSKVYDDANGQPIVPGTAVQGHPTIGIGRALDVEGLFPDEVDYLFNNNVTRICAELDQHLAWWRTLSDPRQAVLIDMAFNMGVDGLLGWPHTLAMIQAGQYAQAAESMRDSLWETQVHQRADRLADQMQTGAWQ